MNRNAGYITQISLCATLLIGSGCTCHKPTQQDKLVIFAAASLREVFNAMGEQFRRIHPEVELTFNFAGTQELRAQIEHGAFAEVFASADVRQMDMLAKKGHVQPPVTFAQNKLVVVVAKESSSHIQSLADLPSVSRIVVGAPEVPIGQYTLQLLEQTTSIMPDFKTRIEAKVVSREFNARQILAKVRLGAAQAGFVYQTDALSAPELAIVSIPDDINPTAKYLMAVSSRARNSQLAHQWVDFVLSGVGQSILREAGFMPLTTGH
jgi:molybdate transport system substrate-binding protein